MSISGWGEQVVRVATRHRARLLARAARRYSGVPADLHEDAYQDAILNVMNAPAREDEDDIVGLLTVCLDRRLIDVTRRVTHVPEDQCDLTAAPAAEAPVDPDAAARAAEVLHGLPARQARVLAYRYLLDLEPDEIRHLLGVTPRTYERLVNRGRRAAREALEQLEGDRACLTARSGMLADATAQQRALAASHVLRCASCRDYVRWRDLLRGSCSSVLATVAQRGHASAEAVAVADAHLASCSSCRARTEWLDRVRSVA